MKNLKIVLLGIITYIPLFLYNSWLGIGVILPFIAGILSTATHTEIEGEIELYAGEIAACFVYPFVFWEGKLK